MSFLGTWIHNVAARWSAATLSPSPLAVSAVDTLQLLPLVGLSVVAGRLADRMDRRRVLLATHAGLAMVALLMAALAALGRLGLPALLGLTLAMGVLGAITGPAWQATVPRQVPDAEVPAAVALMSTGFNLARAVGPGVGAWVLLNLGAAWAFVANAASFALIAFLFSRLPPQLPPPPASASGGPLADPRLRRLYLSVAAFGFLAMPSLSLLAVVARDRLEGGAEAYGWLLSAFGVGAVLAGLLVAAGARRFGNRPFIAFTCGLAALGFVQLALADNAALAVAGAATCGAGWIGTLSTINAAVQVRADPAMRGRALAWYLTFAVGGQAAGSFVGGLVAAHFGLGAALGCCAAGLLGLAAVIPTWRARR